jgi:hypothetical protein
MARFGEFWRGTRVRVQFLTWPKAAVDRWTARFDPNRPFRPTTSQCLHQGQEHRGFRRSHKSRAPRACGSTGRRDALRTPKAVASRLPPLPQEQSPARLWERRKARCSSHIAARSIAASAAPTRAERRAPVGAPAGAMLFADRSQKHRGFRRSHTSTAPRPVGAPGGAMLFARDPDTWFESRLCRKWCAPSWKNRAASTLPLERP